MGPSICPFVRSVQPPNQFERWVPKALGPAVLISSQNSLLPLGYITGFIALGSQYRFLPSPSCYFAYQLSPYRKKAVMQIFF